MATAQAISNNSETTLVYDTEDFDVGGGYDTSNGLFTCPAGEGGVYWFYWQSHFRDGAGGAYEGKCHRDPEGGGSFAVVNQSNGRTGGSLNIAQAGFFITLTASDILKVTIQHTQSSTQNMLDTDFSTYWGGFKLIT